MDVEEYLKTRIESLVVALDSFLGDPDEYRDAVIEQVQNSVLSPVSALWFFCDHGITAIQELLALSLDRGSSRESLAELPIRYLRGDNQSILGRPLEDRMNLIFGAFRGEAQSYVVFLPLEGPELNIPGEIFPPGVSLMNGAQFTGVADSFGADGHKLLSGAQAIRVDVDTYLEVFASSVEAVPRDIFAARDLAVRAARQCLDAISVVSGSG